SVSSRKTGRLKGFQDFLEVIGVEKALQDRIGVGKKHSGSSQGQEVELEIGPLLGPGDPASARGDPDTEPGTAPGRPGWWRSSAGGRGWAGGVGPGGRDLRIVELEPLLAEKQGEPAPQRGLVDRGGLFPGHDPEDPTGVAGPQDDGVAPRRTDPHGGRR